MKQLNEKQVPVINIKFLKKKQTSCTPKKRNLSDLSPGNGDTTLPVYYVLPNNLERSRFNKMLTLNQINCFYVSFFSCYTPL